MLFDVWITNTNSTSQHNAKTGKVLLIHEKVKKREYNRRIMHVSFSVSGVLGKQCSMFHKQMAEETAKNYHFY